MCNYFSDCDCEDHYDEGYHVVSPAYGRDYTTAEQAQRDWDNGRDFVYRNISGNGGRYCSKRDFGPGERIEIRYNKLADHTIVKC